MEPTITPLGNVGSGKVVHATDVALINVWLIVDVMNEYFQMAPFIIKKGEVEATASEL